MQVDSAVRLDPGQVEQVLALAGAAARADQVRPLSEQTLLEARAGSRHSGHPGVRHHLVHDGPRLVGYAQRTPGEGPEEPSSAEVVVEPSARRRGVGRALLDAVLEEDPASRVWAHGDLEAGRSLAAGAGLDSARQLWQMRRPLRGEWSELPPVRLPAGFVSRAFEPGRASGDVAGAARGNSGDVAGAARGNSGDVGESDEEAWLRVNRRAFASHAEQGRMTRADLDQRMAEPWFDPKGFLLVEDASSPGRPVLAGFHWTKIERPENPRARPTSGEVYVVGVDPAYQGRGLGKAVTLLGLEHLRDQGLEEATLYVDGDNEAALATYARLGFERSAVDVMYAAPRGGA